MNTTWSPTPEQKAQYEKDGYCILKNVISRDEAMMIRGVILNHVLTPERGEQDGCEADPMDPMNKGGDAAARQARFRKLNAFGQKSPVLWHQFYCGPKPLAIARHFLGDNIVLKFDSCFLKPAKTGASTPWHQDNGLWRDGEVEPFNIWMAIDPATKENGCLQFIPGSHREPIFPHVEYPTSIHGEIPREEVERAKKQYGLHHIVLEPGDAVCWHSNLFHYSPPNTSEKSRIAIAAVFCTAELAANNPYHQGHLWCMRDGKVLNDFPPRKFTDYRVEKRPMASYPKADEPAVALA